MSEFQQLQEVAIVIRPEEDNVAVVTAGQLIGGRLSGFFYPLDLADTTQWF